VALTDREKAVLDFERSWWTQDGVKDALIEERFGLSSSRYYQVLNELLERPEAQEYDPLVVRRLRRLREKRRRSRLGAASTTSLREGEA
jgi:SOS-response transcriptional repressor LexA